MKNIVIRFAEQEVVGKLNGSSTAGLIWDKLPIKSFTSLWGEEIYFQIPVKTGEEKGFSQDTVKSGELAYWPKGQCFCIFFGPTPVSRPGEIKPASNVNVIGEIESGIVTLKSIKENEPVTVEGLDD